MATAEELLAAAGATEEVLVVNPDTRVISIPATIKILGVESDDDVKRLHFEVPRYYGEFDLSEFETRINYKNARGGGDFYMVDDLAVSEDQQNITFSWLVDRFAFNYSGDVDFSICMRLLDENNITIKEWNTTYASLPVLDGLETEKAVVDQNPTAFNQVLCRLYAVEAATGNGQHGYYTVIRVDETDTDVKFTIVNQDGETVATVKNGENGITYTPSYNYEEGVIYWSNDRGMPNPDPMYIKGDQGEKGDKGEKGEPGKDGKLSSILYVDSPFRVYDYPRNTDRDTYYANGTTSTVKYTELIPCPKYLGWKSTGSAAVTIYIGTVDSSGKFVRDTTYDIYVPKEGTSAINYFNSTRNNLIEVADGHVFYYRTSNVTETDTVTIIGGNNLFEGAMDDIAVIPNYVRKSGSTWVDTLGTDCYGIVLPTDSYYMVLRKNPSTDSVSKAATNLADIKVSYEDPDGTIHVSEASPFGYIPANSGVAQITVPKDGSLNDLLIYTSKPVKSNNTSGKRRLVKEIGRDAITKFTFIGKQNIGWNDNTKRTMLDRRFYGVPYSSRWMNSHFVGFEVSPETALNAFNDPYSIAYDGGILTDNDGNEINKVEITGKSEVGSRGGVGYGLVCSAFALLMGGSPYPQTNRGFTFDSNFTVNKTTDVNAGMHLVNRGMSHVVTVDEVYDSGYALYEATDPCIAQTIHTVENPGYAATQTRLSFLDDYVYSVGYHDIGGYDTNMVNFDVFITECKVRPWRGHKCVYGPWDKSKRGSRICATVDTGVQSFTLSIPADTDKGIAAKTETITVTETNFADISNYVTASGTYILDADETDSEGNAITTRFRYFNHDDIILNFDKDGKAYFSHDDVEYVYVEVEGYGGEFSKYTASDFGMTEEEFQNDKIGPMVIAKGKYYPDLAKDPSRIVDVRAAIVKDKTVNDSWGKYSVPASFGRSEYVDKDEVINRTKADAIISSSEGEIIILNDSSSDPIRGLNLFGKTTQFTTTGKQLLNNTKKSYTGSGITFTSNDDGSITISGTSVADAYYLFDQYNDIPITETELIASISGSNDVSLIIGYYTNITTETFVNDIATVDSTTPKTLTFPADAVATRMFLGVAPGKTINATVYPMLRLATIEDDSYEPFTGGTAAPNPDYPQELESVEPTVNVYSKNLWNHEYDTIDMSNAQGWGNPIWVNKNTIKILRPNTTYTLRFNVTCLALPEYETVFSDDCGFVLYSSAYGAVPTVMAKTTKQGIFSVGETRTAIGTFTTPSNVCDPEMNYEILRYTQRFLKSDGNAVFATVKFDNVQLELGDTATEYESYKGQTVNIPRTLPGIPVTSGGNYTDSDNQQWICDEVDFERGVYVQRVNVADFENAIGERNEYPTGSGHHRFNFTFKNNPQFMPGVNVFAYKCMCNALTGCSNPLGLNDMDNAISSYTSGGLYARCDRFSTTNDFVAWAKEVGLTVAYVLATPIETPLSAAELTAFKALTTNHPNTTILNDSGAWMDVKYNADLKTWVMNYVAQMLKQEV